MASLIMSENLPPLSSAGTLKPMVVPANAPKLAPQPSNASGAIDGLATYKVTFFATNATSSNVGEVQ